MASALVNFWNSLWETLLSSLGLGGGKEGTLLLLGLDNAGKTTLLHRLRTGDVKHFPPTDRPYQSDAFSYQGITFQAWDVGGHEAVRHIWEDYVCECSAVLFLVDATDADRMEEAGFELDALELTVDCLLKSVVTLISLGKLASLELIRTWTTASLALIRKVP